MASTLVEYAMEDPRGKGDSGLSSKTNKEQDARTIKTGVKK